MANRTVLVRLHANSANYIAAMKAASAATRDLHNEIDKTNDRTAWLAQGILAVAPAATTMGAGAVPVLSGMATQMTVAATAAGVMALGFNGVGDALGALNDYQLDPTAENLEDLSQAMDKVGEEGERFVRFLDSLSPQWAALASTSREGMFPGITNGLREFMELAPQLDRIIARISTGIGQLAKDAGRGLSGEGFADFFDYLENDARPILVQFGRTIGNFVEGMANMVVAFGPLSADFSKGFLEMSRSFVEWSDGLANSNGFIEFVDYVRESGPLALDFLSSLGSAFVEILEAAAPIGELMLPALSAMFDVIAKLADTPLGPVVIGFAALTSAWGRLNAVAAITGSGVMSKATAGMRLNLQTANMLRPSLREVGNSMAFAAVSTDKLKKSMQSAHASQIRTAKSALLARTQVTAYSKSIAPVAGQLGLLGLAATGTSDKLGLTNTTTLALAGSLGGVWGAAAGAAVGLMLDMKSSADAATEGFRGLDAAIESESIELLTRRINEAKTELEDINESNGFKDWLGDQMADLFTGGAGEGITEVYTREIEMAEEELIRLKNTRQDVADDRAFYNSLQAETEALEANIAAMRLKREEALIGLNSELDYQESLLDTSEAAKEYAGVLKDNGQLMPGLKREGIEAKRELTNLAAAWNGLSDEAQNTPGRFKKARENFVNLAIEMGYSEKAAKRLADEILNIPSERTTRIKIDADAAFQRLRAFRRSMENIDREIVVGVSVVRGDSSGLAFLSGGIPAKADGGDIPGPRGVYGDKVLIAAAPTEFMVSNRYGQADKNREELKAANAGAKLAVVGYADGGTIGATGRSVSAGRSYPAPRTSYASTAGGAAIDYDRLASAMLLARPLYGPVSINGDPSEFKRQMLHDEQATGIGGFGG